MGTVGLLAWACAFSGSWVIAGEKPPAAVSGEDVRRSASSESAGAGDRSVAPLPSSGKPKPAEVTMPLRGAPQDLLVDAAVPARGLVQPGSSPSPSPSTTPPTENPLREGARTALRRVLRETRSERSSLVRDRRMDERRHEHRAHR